MSKRPDFKKINLFEKQKYTKEEWEKQVQAELNESIDHLLFQPHVQARHQKAHLKKSGRKMEKSRSSYLFV